MIPIFKILADSMDVTATIQSLLLNLKTTDESGTKSDVLTFDLDDRASLIALPRHGTELTVFLGYQQTGLSKIGTYFVDETSMSGFPQTISVSAKAADMTSEQTGDIKAPQTRHFDSVTLGDLVKTIAGEHGLNGKTAASLSDILYVHIDQTAESNLHLLTRLAAEHNAVAKVTNDVLLFAQAGAALSMGGAALPVITIYKNQVADYHCSLTDRGHYKAVTATWHNKLTGQTIAVSTGMERPAFLLRHTYVDEENAIRAAKAKLEALNNGTDTVEVSLPGNPNVFAESPLVLSDFRPGISGKQWTITRVEHTFSNSGFKTQITGEAR